MADKGFPMLSAADDHRMSQHRTLKVVGSDHGEHGLHPGEAPFRAACCAAALRL